VELRLGRSGRQARDWPATLADVFGSALVVEGEVVHLAALHANGA
jgi:hypothetical protein